MSLVSMTKVCKTYHLDEQPISALTNIDLRIDHSEFIAVWGPSGSGKSTLCNLMGTLDLPTSGKIQIEGQDVAALSDDQLSVHRNKTIGFVFQNFNLIKVLTAVENIMLPLTLRGEEAEQSRARALSLLEEMSLTNIADRIPDKLSGGQQQRVAIARSLITDPLLVIADEPTANLDSASATRIIDQMAYFNRNRGTTFVFSTHDQRLLDKVSRKVHLQDGVIVEDVSHDSTDVTQEAR